MLVETFHLTKRYGPFTALDDCSLQIDAGEVFGLLGPNGAGKTTLLRLLMGFLRPTSGRASIAGLDCWRQSVGVHRHTAYLPGDVHLFPRLRGRAVLDFFVGMRTGGSADDAHQLADRLQLDLSRRVAQMSTGMRQKLALAITFAAKTPLMILDEPTANLDPSVRSEIISLVQETRQRDTAVIFSSHIMSEVEEACDRVVILRGGQIVHTQAMESLRRHHRIRLQLSGALPPLPAEFRSETTTDTQSDGCVTIDTSNDLAPLLAWLATLSIEDVQIAPLGIRAIYDKYHTKEPAPQEAAS